MPGREGGRGASRGKRQDLRRLGGGHCNPLRLRARLGTSACARGAALPSLRTAGWRPARPPGADSLSGIRAAAREGCLRRPPGPGCGRHPPACPTPPGLTALGGSRRQVGHTFRTVRRAGRAQSGAGARTAGRPRPPGSPKPGQLLRRDARGRRVEAPLGRPSRRAGSRGREEGGPAPPPGAPRLPRGVRPRGSSWGRLQILDGWARCAGSSPGRSGCSALPVSAPVPGHPGEGCQGPHPALPEHFPAHPGPHRATWLRCRSAGLWTGHSGSSTCGRSPETCKDRAALRGAPPLPTNPTEIQAQGALPPPTARQHSSGPILQA